MLNFFNNPADFCSTALVETQRRERNYRRFLYVLNTITIAAGTFASVLTTLILSKQVPFLLNANKSVPDWYFFVSAGLSALVSFFLGLINFFVVREKIKTYYRKREDILIEYLDYQNHISDKYKNKKTAIYNLYTNISLILDIELGRTELK